MGSQVPSRAPWGRGSVGVELRGSRDPVDGVPWGGASRTGFQLAGLQRGRGSTGAGDRTRLAGLWRYRACAHAALLCSPGRPANQVVRVSLTHPRALPGPLRGPGCFSSIMVAQPAPWPPAARGSPEKPENGCHPATGPGGPGGMDCIPGGSQVSAARDGCRGVKCRHREWGGGITWAGVQAAGPWSVCPKS